jgi:4-amino-4-deoxy-L-arabinose transferase-like glycosyltransferase
MTDAAHSPAQRTARCWDSPGAMFAVAFLIRLIASAFAYRDLLDPRRDYWEFGWETGRIAHSIVTGHGFASPLYGAEGPTAWMAPVYPYLLAGIFRVFGTFTAASAFTILALNSLLSALTCIPVYFIAKRVFGQRTARWAGWTWALYPYAIYFASGRVWETSLTTLLFSLAVWLTFFLADGAPLRVWLLYGALWALTALSSPMTLIVLPLLMSWVAYRLYPRGQGTAFVSSAVTAGLIFLVLVSPWFLRNYRTFHHFIPFRDNLGLELWVGNNGDTSDVYIDWAHPAHNPAELQQYRELGEFAYCQAKKAQALAFIGKYPGFFLWLAVRRVTFIWTGFWSFRSDYLANEPFEIPNMLVSTILSILMLIGIRRSWRSASADALPLVFCLAVFPVLYYVTHVDSNYRHPIDPVIILFAVYGLTGRR